MHSPYPFRPRASDEWLQDQRSSGINFVLFLFQGLIDGQKKYVPEKILTFCKESLHTDHTDDVSVTVTVERNGRTIKLNDRMTRMIQKLSQKIKEEVHKDNKMEE